MSSIPTRPFDATLTPPPRPCLTPDEVRALLDRDLSCPDAFHLLAHAHGCARCGAELEEQRRAAELLGQLRASQPAPPPPVVPGYRVDPKPLGKGSYGWVYKGWHETMKRWDAIKRLPPGFADEARVMANLRPHPHRVQIYDARDQPDEVLLVLFYADGGSLRALMPLPWERAVRYTLHAGLGLQGLHTQGRMHRDIKPGNVFLDATEDIALLGDYGLATLDAGQRGPTGTPGYIAPELWDGPATAKSDVFSLAATLYALLTGHAPFAQPDVYESLLAARAGLPTPDPKLTNVPRGVEALVRGGLEPNPNLRWTLERFLEEARRVRVYELAEALSRYAPPKAPVPALQVDFQTAPPLANDFQPLTPTDNGADPATLTVQHGHVLRVWMTAVADGYFSVILFDPDEDLQVCLPSAKWTDNTAQGGKARYLDLRMRPSQSGDRLGVVWSRQPRHLTPAGWSRMLAGHRGADPLHYGVAGDPEEQIAAVVVAVHGQRT